MNMNSGEIIFADFGNKLSTIDKYVVTEIWKVEKKERKERKPYNVYKNGCLSKWEVALFFTIRGITYLFCLKEI